MEELNKIKLQIGDPSDDGHGEYVNYYFLTNKTVDEIMTAYDKSVKLTNCTWTGNKIGQNYNEIFCQYDERRLEPIVVDILLQHGIDVNEIFGKDCYFYHPEAVKLFILFVKLSLPDLIMNKTSEDVKLLPITIGYGLFE